MSNIITPAEMFASLSQVMEVLDEMWAELNDYQSHAERHGFGDAWRRMCEGQPASDAIAAAWDANRWAACLAAVAAAEAPGSRHTTEWTQRAIGKIHEAIEQEDKT